MINDVMRLDEASFTDVVQVYKLKRAAINLLATMVEKNNDETKELARGILDTIHIGTLYENIVSLQDQGKSDKVRKRVHTYTQRSLKQLFSVTKKKKKKKKPFDWLLRLNTS